MNGLSPAQTSAFQRDGCIFPVDVLGPDEVAGHLASLEALEAARAGRLPPAINAKPHLLLRWLWDLVHDPRIVDPVAELLGPDLLCSGTSFISKSGKDGKFVSWHQDATHWKLSEPRAVTAWLALTPSRRDNGCVRMIPGSHKVVVPHEDTTDPDNLLGRRERVLTDFDKDSAVDVELGAGQMSIHHALVIHGSEPNRSGGRRTGFAIRYLPAEVAQADGRQNFATLVRGRDHGTFALETGPEADFHPDAVKRHAQSIRAGMRVIFEGAADRRAAGG
jgi:ectoine hydroxylase-related dioxygenase (phytanoyl-CoA dioxygenase family)